jgi:hypothetical protein
VALSADGDFNAVMIFCLATRPVVPPRGRYDKSRRIRSAFNCSPFASR